MRVEQGSWNASEACSGSRAGADSGFGGLDHPARADLATRLIRAGASSHSRSTVHSGWFLGRADQFSTNRPKSASCAAFRIVSRVRPSSRRTIFLDGEAGWNAAIASSGV